MYRFTALSPDEDLMQEGYLGLWNAALHYSEEYRVSFSTYAVRCIQNQIYQGERLKIRGNIPNASSLNEKVRDGSDATYMDLVRDPNAELPYEDVDTLDYVDRCLTDEEKSLLRLRMQGIGIWRASKLLGHSGPWGDLRIKRIKEKFKRRND